jgi:hypothetical protein
LQTRSLLCRDGGFGPERKRTRSQSLALLEATPCRAYNFIFIKFSRLKMSYCIVVARHQEDVSWLLDFTPNVYISNKGSLETIPAKLHEFTHEVPNLGLDQYCHLDYIIKNYENLPDVVMFTQAGIQDHHDIHEPIYRADRTKICDTCDPYVKTISSKQLVQEMIDQAHLFGQSLNASHYLYPNFQYCATPGFKVNAPDELTTPLNFGDWFKQYINAQSPSENRFLWFKNAIFAVHKKYILTRPKAFYEALRFQITQPRQDVLHYIERSWYYIFNLDMNLEPNSALNTIQTHLALFKMLDKIVVESGQGWVEGSLFFFGNRDMSYNTEFIHKQINLFNMAKKAKYILEIGFNAGHSTALMLLANPDSKILHFDLKEHAYGQRCYDFLKSVFGAHRFIELVAGDSTKTIEAYKVAHKYKYDLIHIDGGHSDAIASSDIIQCRDYCDPNGHVVIIDDYNMDNLKKLTDKFAADGFIKEYSGVIAKYYGKKYHWIGHYAI